MTHDQLLSTDPAQTLARLAADPRIARWHPLDGTPVQNFADSQMLFTQGLPRVNGRLRARLIQRLTARLAAGLSAPRRLDARLHLESALHLSGSMGTLVERGEAIMREIRSDPAFSDSIRASLRLMNRLAFRDWAQGPSGSSGLNPQVFGNLASRSVDLSSNLSSEQLAGPPGLTKADIARRLPSS